MICSSINQGRFCNDSHSTSRFPAAGGKKRGTYEDIAVSANGKNLEAQVGPLFGRARFFILVDPDTLEWKALDNLGNLGSSQGIGLMAAKSLERKNIRTVLTGSCGPKAFEELQAAGIEVILNAQGTIRQAVASFMNGELPKASKSNVAVTH